MLLVINLIIGCPLKQKVASWSNTEDEYCVVADKFQHTNKTLVVTLRKEVKKFALRRRNGGRRYFPFLVIKRLGLLDIR